MLESLPSLHELASWKRVALRGRERGLDAIERMYQATNIDESCMRENEQVLHAIFMQEIRRSIAEGHFPLSEDSLSRNADSRPHNHGSVPLHIVGATSSWPDDN